MALTQLIPLKQLILNSRLTHWREKVINHCDIVNLWSTTRLKLMKLMWQLTNRLSAVGFFCLGRGTGVDSSGFISVFLSSTSPVVSRFFTVGTRVKSHQCYQATAVFKNFFLPLLNWDNFSMAEGISLSTGWLLFTFLGEQLIPTSSSCYSHGSFFFRETFTRSCPGIVEKRLTLWS